MTELMPSLCNDCISRNQCGKDDVKMCASYIKEIKIKCDDCKFVENCVDYGWDGCKKFTPTPSTPQTNEEWLRTLPADERVKEILSRGFMTEKRTAEEFVEWLKQPHQD